jgi:hypothetical protein
VGLGWTAPPVVCHFLPAAIEAFCRTPFLRTPCAPAPAPAKMPLTASSSLLHDSFDYLNFVELRRMSSAPLMVLALICAS